MGAQEVAVVTPLPVYNPNDLPFGFKGAVLIGGRYYNMTTFAPTLGSTQFQVTDGQGLFNGFVSVISAPTVTGEIQLPNRTYPVPTQHMEFTLGSYILGGESAPLGWVLLGLTGPQTADNVTKVGFNALIKQTATLPAPA